MNSIRESILNAQDINSEPFTSKYWKDSNGKFVTVKIRGITQARRRELVKDCTETETVLLNGEAVEKARVDNNKLTTALIIECTLDPVDDKPVLSREDRDALLQKSAVAYEELANAVMVVCGFQEPAVTEKNSERTERRDSPSVSQKGSGAQSASSTKP
jgi:hypothetical protein